MASTLDAEAAQTCRSFSPSKIFNGIRRNGACIVNPRNILRRSVSCQARSCWRATSADLEDRSWISGSVDATTAVSSRDYAGPCYRLLAVPSVMLPRCMAPAQNVDLTNRCSRRLAGAIPSFLCVKILATDRSHAARYARLSLELVRRRRALAQEPFRINYDVTSSTFPATTTL